MKNLSFPILLIVITFTSCKTLVGTIKPVDEKSDHYQISELEPQDWKKLDPRNLYGSQATVDTSSDAFTSEISDLSYQSKKTAAIISLNSSCRAGRPQLDNLQVVTRELLLGIGYIVEKTEKELKLDGTGALETTIEGKIEGQPTKIRTVVLSQNECVYDIMYISRPDKFPVHEADFTRFVSSLRLR